MASETSVTTGIFSEQNRDLLNDLLLIAEVIFFGAAAIAVIRYGLRAAV